MSHVNSWINSSSSLFKSPVLWARKMWGPFSAPLRRGFSFSAGLHFLSVCSKIASMTLSMPHNFHSKFHSNEKPTHADADSNYHPFSPIQGSIRSPWAFIAEMNHQPPTECNENNPTARKSHQPSLRLNSGDIWLPAHQAGVVTVAYPDLRPPPPGHLKAQSQGRVHPSADTSPWHHPWKVKRCVPCGHRQGKHNHSLVWGLYSYWEFEKSDGSL